MATLDAMHTPPSASLAAILTSPVTHVQCALFSPAAISNSLCSRELGKNDESSTSDKENSPSYAFWTSNRASSASPAMKTMLSFSPMKQQLSFTPQRVRPPPRAWERRPATPFVARSEGQKIWKRVPLQELGVEISQRISRKEKAGKEKAEKENYLRVVKRLRLDTDEIIILPGDQTQHVAAVGTLWEEENIEKDGSPKKKKRVEWQSQDTPLAESATDENIALIAEDINAENATCTTRDQKIETSAPCVTEDSILINTERNTDHTHNFSGETETRDFSDRRMEQQGDENGDHSKPTSTHDCTKAESEILPFMFTGNEYCTCTYVTHEATVVSGHDLCTQDAPSVTGMESAVIISDEQTTFFDEEFLLTTTSQEENAELNNVEQFDSIALSANPPQASASTRSAAAFLSSDNDETAFLRDFLERAQASKAARTIFSPQKSFRRLPSIKESELCLESNEAEDTEPVDDIEDDDLSPPLESANLQQPALIDEIKPSSPTRRSARTATRVSSSRLPRFVVPPAPHFGPVLPSQPTTTTLPSTILLKRATGNEFIFNAKSQQTLVMITQSNTKKNQGEAVYVAQRLAQLRKELEVQQQEGSSEAQVAQAEVEVDATIDEDAKGSSTKKRKRGKQDDANASSKARRRIRWPSDEQLVEYREPVPSVHDSENESGSDEKQSTPPLVPEAALLENGSSKPTSISKDRTASKSETKAKQPNSVDDSAKSKVRRIRKIKLDSVNGTPAPKTRSRCITDSETTESTQDSTFATGPAPPASTTSTRKSSRMPVPISTPIPLPSFTLTKSKSKTVKKEENEVKPATLTSKSQVEMNGAKEAKAKTDDSAGEPVEAGRKLDGRRRLRGRN